MVTDQQAGLFPLDHYIGLCQRGVISETRGKHINLPQVPNRWAWRSSREFCHSSDLHPQFVGHFSPIVA